MRTGRERTGNGEAYRHEEPDEMVDDLERGPFLSAKELPGPRGKNECVPSGDGQRADEKILVSRREGRRRRANGSTAAPSGLHAVRRQPAGANVNEGGSVDAT